MPLAVVAAVSKNRTSLINFKYHTCLIPLLAPERERQERFTEHLKAGAFWTRYNETIHNM